MTISRQAERYDPAGSVTDDWELQNQRPHVVRPEPAGDTDPTGAGHQMECRRDVGEGLSYAVGFHGLGWSAQPGRPGQRGKIRYGCSRRDSGLTLDPSYYNLFTSAAFSGTTVPSECLFALLWVPNGQYFVQNHMQANLAYTPLITQTGDGWGAAFGGSPSLMNWYFNVEPNDTLRRRATVFMPNSFYPDINRAGGRLAGEYHLIQQCAESLIPGQQGNGYGNDHAYVKKYVIGSPADNGGLGGIQSENLNTYIFRLDDVYLDLAEAILGNNVSTSDPTALQYFNAIRTRAGLTKTSIMFADIFNEKKAEFAFEGHEYYDWKEWYYFDPTDALAYFSNQNRGTYNITYNAGNSFITFFGSNGYPGTVTYPITTQDLVFLIRRRSCWQRRRCRKRLCLLTSV